MQEIIKKIKSGELSRYNDETGAEGFWDRAGEVADIVYQYDKKLAEGCRDCTLSDIFEKIQDAVYNDYWELYEELTK